jgi:glycosyltransferase involved in cell wall biosynthesis
MSEEVAVTNSDYLLSIVVPMYNEELGTKECVRRLKSVLQSMGCRYELIFVNDGSRDSTLAMLKSEREQDNNIRIINLSRNFGHQIAITAGIDMAKGDAIIIIDGDLQDPPEIFPELVAKWQAGNDVVHARRKSREGETVFKRWTAAIYYRLIREIAHIEIPVDVGDYRLISRRAQQALLQLRERHRYVRGLVAWVGFNQAFVDYDREKRFAGTTHYPFLKMLSFSIAGLSGFSVVPLRVSSVLGALSACTAFIYACYALYTKFVANKAIDGWSSVVIVVLFLGGIQLLCLGIIGEYIGIVHEEIKGRPLYLVNDVY